MATKSKAGIAISCFVAALGTFSVGAQSVRAGGCAEQSAGPDVIVGELSGWSKWGTLGGVSAYSFGAISCNIGDQILPWIANSNQHPVIASNAYRLKDGRFEQIGMSWMKHGWGALTNSTCCPCINPQNFEALGIGCADPYDSGLNGDQGGITSGGNLVSGLGPRSQINGYTGAFAWPYATQGQSGNALYKRMQIPMADLDPAQNSGALYFGECYYITPHDAAGVHPLNNASHRRFTVGSISNGSHTLAWTGSTQRELAAIHAWKSNDPAVTIINADVPGEGRFILGYKASDNRDGTWHYEYALYNHNSNRAGSGLHVPVASTIAVTNLGFHDLAYHSGDGLNIGTNYDGTDWAASHAAGNVNWTVVPAVPAGNSNALRWGTLYNYRFDASAPPACTSAVLDLFVAGSPGGIDISTVGPRRAGDADGSGVVDIDDLLQVVNGWGRCGMGCCSADVAPAGGNGVIDIDDLLGVINNWG
jgi:hypothetical protein